MRETPPGPASPLSPAAGSDRRLVTCRAGGGGSRPQPGQPGACIELTGLSPGRTAREPWPCGRLRRSEELSGLTADVSGCGNQSRVALTQDHRRI
ncbi:unnamed protein product [Lepidochelys kempii]